MKQQMFVASLIALLSAAPVAIAQTNQTDAQSSDKMKGPPNANGAQTGRSDSDAKTMPNADDNGAAAAKATDKTEKSR